ncbi:MAG TPA: NifU family protein [Candidatus Binataceae bacterium]|nr:NifU family protein [Candidatus Binataceae bacterium]
MPDRGNLDQIGERIERLLEEIRSMASPPTWERVDQLIRLILELYGSGIGRILDIAADGGTAGEAIIDRFAQDELVSSLLVLHGLHPDDFGTRVRKALTRVRPYLGSHGGDVELVEADTATGVVRLRMEGSCESCPSSTLTVKLAVEGAIREAAPELTRLEVEGIQASDHSGLNGLGGHVPKWTALGNAPALEAGDLAAVEIGGARIVLCKVGRSLYAYRDSCPACAAPIHRGMLNASLLTCASCGQRFDIRLAGRSPENGELHLEPVPLLEDGAGVRVALAEAPA